LPARGFHRDTWGTNLYAQVNWWAPVYPITAGRTVALYPTLWSRPVANTSALRRTLVMSVLVPLCLGAAWVIDRVVDHRSARSRQDAG
jgi:hypothetical protein